MKKNKLKILRLHDKFYLKENRYKKPKESFKFLVRLLKKLKLNFKNEIRIGDFGCGNGESSYYLINQFPKANIYGGDIDKEILFKDERIETFYVDQRNSEQIKSMWSKINKKFDIIKRSKDKIFMIFCQN